MHSFTLALSYANRISCIRLNKFGSTSFSFRDLLFVCGGVRSKFTASEYCLQRWSDNEFLHIAT